MQKTITNYHETVLGVWKSKHGSVVEGFKRVPLLAQPPDCERVDVLTLGMNPSFVPESLIAHWERAQHEHPEMLMRGLAALDWNALQTESEWQELRNAVARLDKHSRANYKKYYGPIEELVALAGKKDAWYHTDLFPLRETDQKTFTAKLRVPRNSNERVALRDSTATSKLRASYAWDQAVVDLFNASIELIIDLKPRVIVVLNSYASQMLEYRLPLTKQGNGHRYVYEKLPDVPFLLGSQLSGGATSIYAKERLLADLRDVIRYGDGLNGGGEDLSRDEEESE